MESVADALFDPLRQGVTQRALVEIVLLGAVAGPLGVWIVSFRHAYAAESLAHAMLPALVGATLAGIPLVVGAVAGAVGGAALIGLAARHERVGGDVAVAVTITALLGGGALLGLAPAVPARLGELLFGNLIGVGWGDVAVAGGLAGAVLIALLALHRPLTLAAFDPAVARALGTRPGRTDMALLVILAVTIVAAVQALGNLLVLALLIAPGAAALRVASRLPAALALSALLGCSAGVIGVYASFHLDVAAGAAIALAAIGTYGLLAAAEGLRPGARPTRRRGARPPATSRPRPAAQGSGAEVS